MGIKFLKLNGYSFYNDQINFLTTLYQFLVLPNYSEQDQESLSCSCSQVLLFAGINNFLLYIVVDPCQQSVILKGV